MYYFDNEFLKGYLDIVPSIIVYINGQPVTISNKQDLEDTQVGVASDEYGKPVTFTYPQIQQVVAKGQTITMDQLQKVIKGQQKKPKQDAEKPQGGEEEKQPEGGQSVGQKSKNPFAGGENKPEGGKKEEKPKNPFAGSEESAPKEKPDQGKEKSKKESAITTHHFYSVDNPNSPQDGLSGIVRHQDSYGIVIEAYNTGATWQPWDMVTVRKEDL